MKIDSSQTHAKSIHPPRLFAAFVLAVAVLAPTALLAQVPELDAYQGSQPVIVVFTRDLDDLRPFMFNLTVSSEWDRLEARNLAVLDIDEARFDVDTVSRRLSLGEYEFAIILFARDGTRLFTTDSTDSLDEILQRLDLYDPDDTR